MALWRGQVVKGSRGGVDQITPNLSGLKQPLHYACGVRNSDSRAERGQLVSTAGCLGPQLGRLNS